ncbi:MAG: DUF5662 family protein [Clostridiales bacterium]|nr:DUF5662 family protein [Clostridiales bacterium]
MSNLVNHFKTITRHKLLVMKYCFRLGLYRQGLLHDLSKYSPTEFIPGVIYFQGDRSPNDAERRDKGYSEAWMHHKGRNKHHLEYWTDYKIGTKKGTMSGVKMPLDYVLEMFCDRIAACRIYNGESYTDDMAWNYFMRGRAYTTIHPETAAFLEKLLRLLAKYGEEKTFRFIRCYRKHHRSY